MTLAAGSKLGPYEILGQIGAGGMGEVYRAKDPRLGREVAIKVLPASFSADADRLIGVIAPAVQPWPRSYDAAVGAESERRMRRHVVCRDPFDD